jgi:hypothetical protein
MMVHIVTARPFKGLNIQQPYLLATECIYGLHVIPRKTCSFYLTVITVQIFSYYHILFQIPCL